MKLAIWLAIGFFALLWVWVGFEIYRSPLMPDDFDLTEEDMWLYDERPTGSLNDALDEQYAKDREKNGN